MADGREQREVVEAVGVRVAVAQLDVVGVGPRQDGAQLARAPHELAGDGAVVGAVDPLAVLGGDDLVDLQRLGEGSDDVEGRRRGQGDEAPGGVVLGDERPGEGLHERREEVGGELPGPLRRRPRPAGGEAGGVAGADHRQAVLPHHLEQPEQQLLAGDRPLRQQADLLERLRDDRPRPAPQQRAVEVEDGSATTFRHRPGHYDRPTRPGTKNRPAGGAGRF
jgi:hypothetical protein